MGAVIYQLNRLTASKESSVQQLADQITKDPGLTSKVLKVANSAQFNPTKTSVSTISRAIMQVGFDSIKAICISSMIMENLLKKRPRDLLIKRMARAFLAATQARALCEKARPESKEEVFVAALLLHIGEMLIWTYDHPVVDKAYLQYRQGASEKDLESLLGVKFDRLTLEIAREWNLGSTLNEVLAKSEELGSLAQAVKLGEAIAAAVEKGGGTALMLDVIKDVAEFTGKPESEVKKKIQMTCQEATENSAIYCDPKITRLLKAANTQNETEQEDIEIDYLVPDQEYQLKALQNIMMMTSKGGTPADLFQQVLKGVHNGVGLERVALAIFNTGRTQVSARYIIGQKTTSWREKFRFDYERRKDNIFAAVMASKRCAWLGNPEFYDLETLRSDRLNGLIGIGDFLIGPIIANNRQVGFLYGDMRVTGRELNESYFTGFKHFVQQTALCLGVLAKSS